MFAAVPLSLVYPYLPPSTRSPLVHIYSLALVTVFCCFTLPWTNGFLQLLASSIVTWCIVKIGVKQKWGASMQWIVFGVALGHLTFNNIIAFMRDPTFTKIDISGSHLVLVMKLHSFACSVYDGQRPLEELDETQKASRIPEVPGLLPFLGYAFFMPSMLVGPSFTYASYDAFTSHRLFAKEQAAGGKTPPKVVDPTVIPPGRRRKAAKRLLTGIFFLVIYSLYGAEYNMARLLDSSFVKGKSFWAKFIFMNIAGAFARFKYYAVWCIAESSCILSGLGYNPRTGHYDASRNLRIRNIELAPNFKVLLDSWNMNANVWLRECIYKRLAKKGRKPGFKSTQITFIVSALWHGVNPCYLMTFVLGGFCQAVNRSLRAGVRPFALPPGALTTPSSIGTPVPMPKVNVQPGDKNAPPPRNLPKVKLQPPPQTPIKTLYDIVGTICTLTTLNFAVVPFLLLDARLSIRAWREVDFYALYMIFVPFLVLNVFGGVGVLKKYQKRRDRKRTEREEEQEKRRIEWEAREERKRKLRGEGLPSLGLDVEEMLREEEEEERRAAAAAQIEGKKKL